VDAIFLALVPLTILFWESILGMMGYLHNPFILLGLVFYFGRAPVTDVIITPGVPPLRHVYYYSGPAPSRHFFIHSILSR